MPTRKYARALVEIGVGRCGKGVRRRILKALLGKRYVFEVSLEDLTMPHGMEGAPGSRVVAVPEISRLGPGKADKAGEVVRKILGLDDIQVNPKGVKAKQVMVEAAIMMSGHEIPTLSNKARGLSGKLLPLANNRSWLGKEDFGLEDRLIERELQGIAARWVRGAQRLEAERDPGKKWVLPSRSVELIRHFELENNPAQGFLEECFVQREEGWVPLEWVWNLWAEWRRKNRIKGGTQPRRSQFGRWLEGEGAWNLMVGRSPQKGTEEVVWGMSAKSEVMMMVWGRKEDRFGEAPEEGVVREEDWGGGMMRVRRE
jgi:phage/plasmid-associated DNA primase